MRSGIRPQIEAGIRPTKTNFGGKPPPLGSPWPASFRAVAMVQLRRLPSAAADRINVGETADEAADEAEDEALLAGGD